MEFALISFLKVLVVVVCHAGFLYFIFRQLDKIFLSGNPMLPQDNVAAIYGEDLYLVQVRTVGGDVWSDAAAPGPYSAARAAEIVANLNARATCTVYCAMLVK